MTVKKIRLTRAFTDFQDTNHSGSLSENSGCFRVGGFVVLFVQGQKGSFLRMAFEEDADVITWIDVQYFVMIK